MTMLNCQMIYFLLLQDDIPVKVQYWMLICQYGAHFEPEHTPCVSVASYRRQRLSGETEDE